MIEFVKITEFSYSCCASPPPPLEAQHIWPPQSKNCSAVPEVLNLNKFFVGDLKEVSDRTLRGSLFMLGHTRLQDESNDAN